MYATDWYQTSLGCQHKICRCGKLWSFWLNEHNCMHRCFRCFYLDYLKFLPLSFMFLYNSLWIFSVGEQWGLPTRQFGGSQPGTGGSTGEDLTSSGQNQKSERGNQVRKISQVTEINRNEIKCIITSDDIVLW
jgi:hypothetical protein